MARSIRIGAGVGVDTSELRAFVAATRKASTVAATGIHTAMLAAGEIVAAEARILSAQHSESIPPTIKTVARGASISVQAGGPKAPVAAPYESAKNGTFRHPVFGNREVWVQQPGYPFLRPAAQNKAAELEGAVLKLADEMVGILATG